MTITTALGQVLRDAGGVRLEFVRTYDTPLEDVWSAVTDSERLARWFGTWSGDPATGSVEVVMSAEGGTQPQSVTIDECDPPRHLALTVPGPDGPWPLDLTLYEQEGQTTMRFIHHLAEPFDARSIGPGWHFYLDRLGAVVTGAPAPDSWDDYYPALADAYYPVPDEPAANFSSSST